MFLKNLHTFPPSITDCSAESGAAREGSLGTQAVCSATGHWAIIKGPLLSVREIRGFAVREMCRANKKGRQLMQDTTQHLYPFAHR